MVLSYLWHGNGPMQQSRQITAAARRRKPSSGIALRLNSPAPDSSASNFRVIRMFRGQNTPSVPSEASVVKNISA